MEEESLDSFLGFTSAFISRDTMKAKNVVKVLFTEKNKFIKRKKNI